MNSNPPVRPIVTEAKQRLVDGRAELCDEHRDGCDGETICRKVTDLVDGIVEDLYNTAVEEATEEDRLNFEEKVTLIVHGGSGRREMAPYSDVDLMLLHDGADLDSVERLARRMTQDVFDVGLLLGLSVRTPRQAFQLIPRDATVYTSLCESRYLCGNAPLYDRYWQRFTQVSKRRTYFLIDSIEKARREERVKYGETVYLLRPNVKRSRGALRDIQLVRWIGMTRYGERDLKALHEQEFLSDADFEALSESRQFLMRLRNELHFSSGKSQDSLNRRDQVRIAEMFGYTGNDAVLPVEQFMSDYFRHTSDVRYSSAHFVASAKSRSTIGSIVGPMFSLSYEGDFRVGPRHVGGTRQGLEKVTKNLVDVLRLMELANAFNRRIDHPTWQAIREAMMARPNVDLTPEATKRFMALLTETNRLADLMRRLHEMRVLEQILPAFRHARGLLQFNEYHKYTVDEHSIRAVDYATRFANEDSVLGETYRSIKKKAILHLALLLHDAGKGYDEDHSEVGLRLAGDTAERLNLSEHETETLKFLVHKHLMMAHLALRRDLDDDTVIAEFAAEVGSVEVLKMLYVLSCADLAAVGPGVLNDWKQSLLTEMYKRARSQLAGDYAGSQLGKSVIEAIDYAHEVADDAEEADRLDDAIRRLPSNHLASRTKEELIAHLRTAHLLEKGDADITSRYLETSQSVEFTVAAHDRPLSGYFHKLTGVLTSSGFEIRAAEVTPLGPTLVIMRFIVHDLDHEDHPPQPRLDKLSQALHKVVTGSMERQPSFRTLWSMDDHEKATSINRLATRIRIDNDSADNFTLIDVFANDRLGLLYQITRKLYELELEIRFAKIGTYLDQVVDVFYVTNREGCKVTNDAQLRVIRESLIETLDAADGPSKTSLAK